MGLGVLGQATASALRDLNFKIYGWSRTKKNISGISSYAGLNELNDFLKNVNILVCLLPLTNETENIINKDLLYNLPSGAYLINVGRGKHVIESDLINVLDSGHIEHAFLDVTREEPLPKNSKLWDHPKITLTPHVAAITNAASSSRQIIKNLDFNKGDLSMVVAMFSWAVYSALLKRKKYEISQVTLLQVVIITGLIFLTPIYFIEMYMGNVIVLGIPFVLTLTYVVFFPGLASFFFWIKGISIIGANRAGVFLHLMPIFGAIMAMLIFNERFMFYHIFGAIFIIAGITLSNKKK